MGNHMSRTGIRIATFGAFAGGLLTAFFALSPTAAAEPAPAAPSVPGVDLVQQLANAPAMASQFLQNAANMLNPTPPAAAPATPPPTATGSINLPQLPGMTPASAPLTSAVGTAPPAATPAAPAAPASSMPLLNQLPLPGSIASIAQSIPGIGTNPAAIPSITAPMSTGPMTPPASTPGAPGLPPNLDPFAALP